MSESDDSVTSPDFMALYLILLLIVAISVTTFLILIYSNTTGGKASTVKSTASLSCTSRGAAEQSLIAQHFVEHSWKDGTG